MDVIDHGKIVLGAILGWRQRAAVDEASRHLTEAHFPDTVQKALWSMVIRYLDLTGDVLTRHAVEDGLRSQPPGTTLMYLTYFDTLLGVTPPADRSGIGQFRWSIQQLRELTAERMTGESLTTAMEILQGGVRDAGVEWYGHTDARRWLQTRLSVIEQELIQAENPEGDMRAEGHEVMEEYGRRKGQRAAGTSGSVSTSLPALDELLGGGSERGEVNFVMAWTSAGKTSFLSQMAWHATCMGKNVVYFTTETLRAQIRVKIYARHSREERFGLRHGLNSRDIRAGTLTPVAEGSLRDVVADFGTMPGSLYISQMPRRSTVAVLESNLARITRDRPADLVIMDTVQLLRAEERRRAQWEETAATIKAVKDVATTYMGGRGVPLWTPWQVGRDAKAKARDRGFYALEDMADTQEAANIGSVVLALLAPDEFTGGRNVTLQLSGLKNRDGEAFYGRDKGLTLDADYATCLFTSRATQASGTAALLDVGNFGAEFAGHDGLFQPFGSDGA
jgi:RecA/RadA recombinase